MESDLLGKNLLAELGGQILVPETNGDSRGKLHERAESLDSSSMFRDENRIGTSKSNSKAPPGFSHAFNRNLFEWKLESKVNEEKVSWFPTKSMMQSSKSSEVNEKKENGKEPVSRVHVGRGRSKDMKSVRRRVSSHVKKKQGSLSFDAAESVAMGDKGKRPIVVEPEKPVKQKVVKRAEKKQKSVRQVATYDTVEEEEKKNAAKILEKQRQIEMNSQMEIRRIAQEQLNRELKVKKHIGKTKRQNSKKEQVVGLLENKGEKEEMVSGKKGSFHAAAVVESRKNGSDVSKTDVFGNIRLQCWMRACHRILIQRFANPITSKHADFTWKACLMQSIYLILYIVYTAIAKIVSLIAGEHFYAAIMVWVNPYIIGNSYTTIYLGPLVCNMFATTSGTQMLWIIVLSTYLELALCDIFEQQLLDHEEDYIFAMLTNSIGQYYCNSVLRRLCMTALLWIWFTQVWTPHFLLSFNGSERLFIAYVICMLKIPVRICPMYLAFFSIQGAITLLSRTIETHWLEWIQFIVAVRFVRMLLTLTITNKNEQFLRKQSRHEYPIS